MALPEIAMQNYDYLLPSDSIAQQAAEPRDSAKLLIYKNGQINNDTFDKLDVLLPKDTHLFYNDAKVIPARIFIKKTTGTTIEIFLLKPYQSEYITTLNASSSCEWECLVGNKKKWKEDESISTAIQINNLPSSIHFDWLNREHNLIRLTWDSGHPFLEILEQIGKMPLPPYIKRAAISEDKTRYQTVYSTTEGSVAAPTAGLHFTEKTLTKLKDKGISMSPMTLHVSAGTFLPVTADNATEHPMHQEFFSVTQETLQQLKTTACIVAVGTTSVRVMESIYWCAMNIKANIEQPLRIEKLAPYAAHAFSLTRSEAIDLILDYMNTHHLRSLTGETSIMIMPGYTFKFVNGLITNFHQPKSTLLLLIAAFIGDQWKEVYQHALANNYRFLSYGDSSLLLR